MRYSLLFGVALLTTLGTGCQSAWDAPAALPKLTAGAESAAARVAVVYHPGGSNFTERVVLILGEMLAERGFAVDIMAAGPDVVIPQASYRSIVIASPVYGSVIRPPVQAFLAANKPWDTPVLAVLTGAFDGYFDTYDKPNLERCLAECGAVLSRSVKILTMASDAVIRDGLAPIIAGLEGL
jgi:hypothetical protein